MNPEKTKDGILIGGNSGTTCDEVYRIMKETKNDWGKLDGRQGYHFVLSWQPGEIDEERAYQVVKEFCEEYLGENYDYVYSIHDDQEHIHGHIVFNSVRRTDGYKYRYLKGDWGRYIQPITDKICERNGLPKLEYDSNRKGKSYGEWNAEKEGKNTGIKIIKADIDFSISQADSYNEFLGVMKKIGYKVEPRLLEGKQELALTGPGQPRARRTKYLGEGYRLQDIKERIIIEKVRTEFPKLPGIKSCKVKSPVSSFPFLSRYQVRKVREIYQVQTYYTRKNPYAVNQAHVRRNMMHIEQLTEGCRYLLRMNIRSVDELSQHEEFLKKEEKKLKGRQGTHYILKEEKDYDEYLRLKKELQGIPEWDDRFEEIQDRFEELEQVLPLGAENVEQDFNNIRNQLEEIRQEKRIIRQIKKHDKGLRIAKLQERKNLLPTAEQIMNKAKKGDTEWLRK
jgi:hypothetical protein